MFPAWLAWILSQIRLHCQVLYFIILLYNDYIYKIFTFGVENGVLRRAFFCLYGAFADGKLSVVRPMLSVVGSTFLLHWNI
jgi:hypothetical protein